MAATTGLSEEEYLATFDDDLKHGVPEIRAFTAECLAEMQEASPTDFWDYTCGNWQERDDMAREMVRDLTTMEATDNLVIWARFMRARLLLEDAVKAHSDAIMDYDQVTA